MEIRGKLTGRIVQLLTKANQSNDGKTAQVDVEFRVQRDDSVAKFGADFEELAFATTSFDVDEDCAVHLQDVIKPGSRVRLGQHVITLEGERLSTTPKLFKIEPVEGEETVFATVRIEVDTSRKGLVGKLADQTNDMVTLQFDEAQLELGFKPDAGAGEKAMDGTKGPA